MIDELRVAMRCFAMIMIGYAVVVHSAADSLYLWFDCRLPDPLMWLQHALSHLH